MPWSMQMLPCGAAGNQAVAWYGLTARGPSVHSLRSSRSANSQPPRMLPTMTPVRSGATSVPTVTPASARARRTLCTARWVKRSVRLTKREGSSASASKSACPATGQA